MRGKEFLSCDANGDIAFFGVDFWRFYVRPMYLGVFILCGLLVYCCVLKNSNSRSQNFNCLLSFCEHVVFSFNCRVSLCELVVGLDFNWECPNFGTYWRS